MTPPVLPIEYRTTDFAGIDVIRPLWNRICEHHRIRARTFRAFFERVTFDDRKAYFARCAEAGDLRVDLACDPAAGRCVGYCVTSLSAERIGEVESLYVDEAYRSQGVGTALMHRALAWLDENGSIENGVSVAEGNEEAFPFYRRFGFYPRRTMLEQVRGSASTRPAGDARAPGAACSIREMTAADWDEVRRIYLEGIATGNATFEAEAPSWERWDAGHLRPCRFVAANGERIFGWVAASPTSGRPAYAGVAEVSVYVERDARGQGVGSALLAELIAASEREGFWTLQAGIFPENAPSLALHKKHGFRVIGRRERPGRMKDGRWRDVLLLERRSRKAGL
ncbi:GNAT family N-acetyltransferase [Methanoculleus sp. Wushi-C6]|uniref:GNAT family N-acetyltransferase n=1 Tax=Methanoculleus caldifontis TaxID=2651577 RepID=A0ABU3X2P5_9EURY|nr:GNAT family N-acetyltransferase [Methanoculleus sp. Wushi-C6]MDV2481862.1 GNAT family N-acetyltransferase [Methanoculleus sp. Wushi-C6]